MKPISYSTILISYIKEKISRHNYTIDFNIDYNVIKVTYLNTLLRQRQIPPSYPKAPFWFDSYRSRRMNESFPFLRSRFASFPVLEWLCGGCFFNLFVRSQSPWRASLPMLNSALFLKKLWAFPLPYYFSPQKISNWKILLLFMYVCFAPPLFAPHWAIYF